MSPDAWTFLGVVTTGLVTLSGIGLSYYKTRQANYQTSDDIEEVRRLSAPTGNGFAEKMEKSLDRIERSVSTLSESVGRTEQAMFIHLQDHIRYNLKVGGNNAVDQDFNGK